MIFNKTPIYAKVWSVTPSDKYIDLRISTSEKSQDGTYIHSTWFSRAIGGAVVALKNVKEGDRICITTSKFTNEAYKKNDGDKPKSYFKFLIIEANIENQEKTSEKSSATSEQPAEEDDCPW